MGLLTKSAHGEDAACCHPSCGDLSDREAMCSSWINTNKYKKIGLKIHSTQINFYCLVVIRRELTGTAKHNKSMACKTGTVCIQ